MKKLLLVVLTVLVMFTASACTAKEEVKKPETVDVVPEEKQAEQPEEQTQEVVGGYEKVEDETVTEELLSYWTAANENGMYNEEKQENLLENLEPVALKETQVVAGTNYKFVAKDLTSTEEPAALKEVVIYRDLDGNCYILSINDYTAEEKLV